MGCEREDGEGEGVRCLAVSGMALKDKDVLMRANEWNR